MALSLMRPNLLVLEYMHSAARIPPNKNVPRRVELINGAD